MSKRGRNDRHDTDPIEGKLRVVGIALLVIVVFSVGKVWRSLRLGLVPFSTSIWIACVTTFWIAIELRHRRVAIGVIIGTAAGALLITVLRKRSGSNKKKSSDAAQDSPLPEDGEDLLGLGEAIDALVATILLERPLIVAITGTYGQGKTSFVNLVLGKLKKLDEVDRPIIVKFSPWLAADPNSLVVSLLNSIVIEMKKTYVIPGLKREAFDYARALLSTMPKIERFKGLLSEPSQEEQIARLAKRISGTDRAFSLC